MGSVKVTSEDVQALATALAAASSRIGGASEGAMHQVNAVVNDGWAGAASAQFAELFSQWRQSSDALLAALDGIGAQLTQAAAAYETTEESVRRSMSG